MFKNCLIGITNRENFKFLDSNVDIKPIWPIIEQNWNGLQFLTSYALKRALKCYEVRC